MDGTSGINSATNLDIASGGTSAIAAALLSDNQHLVEQEVQTLFGSLGLGTAVSALA